MSKRRIYALVTGLAAIAVVALMLTFVVLPGGSAAVRSPETASVGIVAPEAMVQEVASRPGGPQEGIAVHGHWTIEVRNPDGSLVECREFDNALGILGIEALTKILARQAALGSWLIRIGGTPGPCQGVASPTYCAMGEPGVPGFPVSSTNFYTLTATLVGTQASSKLVLSGSVTAANDSTIEWVKTQLHICGPNVSPDDCATSIGTWPDFTLTGLSPSVSVQAGQIIMVTVEISFS